MTLRIAKFFLAFALVLGSAFTMVGCDETSPGTIDLSGNQDLAVKG